MTTTGYFGEVSPGIEAAMQTLAGADPALLAQINKAQQNIANAVPGSMSVNCPRDNTQMLASSQNGEDALGNVIPFYDLACSYCGRTWRIPGYDRNLRPEYRSN